MKLTNLTTESLEHIPERIIGYKVDNGYWHTSVWLFGENDECIQFETIETALTDRFEVYFITIKQCSEIPEEWEKLETTFRVKSISFLWRDEWIEKGGSVFCGKINSSPKEAIASATILSGIRLKSEDEKELLINSSTSAPLNVDFVKSQNTFDEIMTAHTETEKFG